MVERRSFKELSIKETYYNSEDDTINSFLKPILECSKIYKRETYSFSSAIFSLLKGTLKDVLTNNCQIYYIVGIEIPESDMKAIADGIKTDIETIEEEIKEEFGNVENMINNLDDGNVKNIYQSRLKILTYLISKKILNLKIGFVSKKDRIVNPSKFKFHPKVMIFEDFFENKIVATGSTNESLGAHIHNEETFDVFKSWETATKPYFDRHYNKFDDFWNNYAENIKTIDINDIVENNILIGYKTNFKNKDEVLELEEELNKLYDKYKKSKTQIDISSQKPEIEIKDMSLRDYQITAISNWVKKGKAGIFSMATGTGKTYTAIGCIKNIIQEEKVGIIITTPQDTLTNQWAQDNLKKFNLECETLFGTQKSELDKIANNLMDIELGDKKYFIICTTFQTFCKEAFVNEINKSNIKLFLICDEAHGIGAPEYRKGLVDKYTYRLGLTATPNRYGDEDGTNYIYDYFYKGNYNEKEGHTYFFDLKRAIKEGFLTEYDYYPYFCTLTQEELKDYIELTKKMGRLYAIGQNSKNSNSLEAHKQLANKRKAIIKNAENKTLVAREILEDMGNVRRCLFFLDTNKQITKIKEIIGDNFPYLSFKTFTTEYFKDKKLKNQILEEFTNNVYNVLLSINCFTEGIDVPSTENAVLIASSTNPKEFIQRRGRVLRKYPGKTKANIYDVIITPENLDMKDSKNKKIANSLIKSELERFETFLEDARDSEVKEKNKKIYKELKEKYIIEENE